MTLTVLVIDDSADDRALATRELKRHFEQVEVLQAGTAEALEQALGQPFDIAITDYQLRFTDGIAVLRELKRRFPERPVIMFTASGNEEVAVEAMKEGLDDYITKTAKHYPRIGFAVRTCLERVEQRRQLEQAHARESLAKTRLEVALASAQMGTWQLDLVTKESTYSDALGPMFGHPPGFTHPDFDSWLNDIHPDDRPAVMQVWDDTFSGKAPYRTRFRALGADGVTRWIESSGTVVRNEAGVPIMIIGAARDVTADVTVQHNLERQRAELQKADRQKNDFLSILAHELRNPLAAAGYSVALLRQAGANPATVTRATGVIDRQITHMARLLDELLDLSRITHNRVELECQVIDLRAVVDMASDSARAALEEKGHELRLSLPAGPVFVDGDEVRLTQVFSNLLNNAAKFTPERGRIGVELALRDGQAIVDVIDDGIGIEAHRLDDVFEMFSQAQNKAHGGTPGLGIGLAVVKSLVELHGGSVTAASPGLGGGTRIRVSLPLARAPQDALPEAAPAPATAAQRPLEVLLADDNTDAADLLAEFLAMHGYTVHTAYDGQSAMALAARIRPRTLVLDIGMPGATGYEVAQWVRQQAWGADATLVAVTGWGQEYDGDRVLHSGFDARLVKPVDIDQLLQLIAHKPA
jgi:signal transduction histidine kinase/DNA-binding response OmpR family regulator